MKEKTYDVELIRGEQLKAGRILLGWSQRTLATKAYMSQGPVTQAEKNNVRKKSTIMLIAHVLMEAGIEFINHEDGTLGVLIKPDADRLDEREDG